MISTKDTADTAGGPRHAMPPGSEDYPDDRPTNVHAIYAKVTGGMQLPMPEVPGAHRAYDPDDTTPVLPRIEVMAHSAFDLAAVLGPLGARTSFARVDRNPCGHCKLPGHITTVRFPNGTAEDACGCCSMKLVRSLAGEPFGAVVDVEVWHPKAGA